MRLKMVIGAAVGSEEDRVGLARELDGEQAAQTLDLRLQAAAARKKLAVRR